LVSDDYSEKCDGEGETEKWIDEGAAAGSAAKPNTRRRLEIDITQAPLNCKAETFCMPSSRRNTLSSDDMVQGLTDRVRGRQDQADIGDEEKWQGVVNGRGIGAG
jgi:hypothetical protein